MTPTVMEAASAGIWPVRRSVPEPTAQTSGLARIAPACPFVPDDPQGFYHPGDHDL